MKTCTACKTPKPLGAFGTDRREGRTHYSHCKECRKAEVNAWRLKNRDAHNAAERRRYAESPTKWDRHLRNKYGIDAAEYERLLEGQGGRCGVCKEGSEETLAVDHDHATGAVRGLLCAKCNRMLGCALDNPATLDAGAAYLRSMRKQRGLSLNASDNSEQRS